MSDIDIATFKERDQTPDSREGYVKLYAKPDGRLYFRNNDERKIQFSFIVYKSVTLIGHLTPSVEYGFGFYDAPVADANLTQASATVNYGSANHPYAAHAFIVAGGAGSASGGTGTVEIEVSGTSITDDGVRTTSDTEIIASDITALSLNQYLETPKKWLGQVTFTLQPSDGSTQTTYNCDFNYGFCKYEDFGNSDFTLRHFETVGKAGGNDTGYKTELLKHGSTGWTYDATAFQSGGTVLISTEDLVTENNLTSEEQFAFKRANLDTFINGSDSEGVIVKITTTAPNAIDYQNMHIGVELM